MPLTAETRASSSRHSGARVLGKVDREHGNDGFEGSSEHVLPLPCGQVLAVIGPRVSFCKPFLLEEGFAAEVGRGLPCEVVEVPFTPGLADTLVGCGVLVGCVVGGQLRGDGEIGGLTGRLRAKSFPRIVGVTEGALETAWMVVSRYGFLGC